MTSTRVTYTDAEADLLDACERINQATEKLQYAKAARDAALRNLHTQDKVPRRQVGAHARALVEQEGWTKEGLDVLGLSDGTAIAATAPARATVTP